MNGLSSRRKVIVVVPEGIVADEVVAKADLGDRRVGLEGVEDGRGASGSDLVVLQLDDNERGVGLEHLGQLEGGFVAQLVTVERQPRELLQRGESLSSLRERARGAFFVERAQGQQPTQK
jgi:hypothetical protein